MIERSEFFVEASELWHEDALAMPEDKLLCSLVSLRLLTSATANLLYSRHSGPKARETHFSPTDTFLSIIDQDISKWQHRWKGICGAGKPFLACSRGRWAKWHGGANQPVDSERCYSFLIQFYASHLRLVLFSISLESPIPCKSDADTLDRRALWICFSSATDMLKHLSGSRMMPLLYFAPDSLHTMTAYAAAFLVKVIYNIFRSSYPLPTHQVKQANHNGYDSFVYLPQVSAANCKPPSSGF